ncbi:MAG TPA: LemA family protein [Bacteroidia bacterium]|nr:LemA family protein [Bacteroidia bacterium]
MKRGTIILIVVAALLLIFAMNGCSVYNNMVDKQEDVTRNWQQVENQYQRRSDLIPNLVAVVRNYADFEKSTLEAVVQARANATRVTISPQNLDADAIQKFDAAQSQVSTTLGRLLAVAENYPNLKANQNFLDLQAQLEGTENRIATERGRFNDVVKDYNAYVRKFPGRIWAGMFGFETHAYFESKEGADIVPDVNEAFKK